MSGQMRVFWGDLHKHMRMDEGAEGRLQAARAQLDFYLFLLYPGTWVQVNEDFRVETVRHNKQDLEDYERLRSQARALNEPGRFISFLGYEWHGNRSRWGDHNVCYLDPGGPLDSAWELEELFANLRKRNGRALAIPHHTAYMLGRRAKDWSLHDEALSPFMEIYSSHGSSEGPEVSTPMARNANMGPRCRGTTFQDALERGLRIGCIASNDGWGLPGTWGQGLAAVRARELTREALWEAFRARRVYGVSGDRIVLDYSVGGVPMGASGKLDGPARVRVTCADALDRIELIGPGGRVLETYGHQGRWEDAPLPASFRFKFGLDLGWGPSLLSGFDRKKAAGALEPQDARMDWKACLRVEDGRLVSIQRRFTDPGAEILEQDETRAAWHFSMPLRAAYAPEAAVIQGLVFEIEGGRHTRVHFELEDGGAWSFSAGELLGGSHQFALHDESRARLQRVFGLSDAQLAAAEAQDAIHVNARKIRFTRAAPQNAWEAEHTFAAPPQAWQYVRVSQVNGQLAWSSPVWNDG